MEAHQGRSVPGVKEFQVEGSWAPPTPAKPSLPPRPGPIFDDGLGGLLNQVWNTQDYLSRCTQQSHSQGQTLSPYSISHSNPTSSNYIWDAAQGAPSAGRIQVQSNNNQVQRRGLEDYLPHWSSQGRRSQVIYNSNFASNSYPNFNSSVPQQPWTSNALGADYGNTGCSFDPLDQLDANSMTFRDLINGSLRLQNNGGATANGRFYPGWFSQPEGIGFRSSTTHSNQEYLNGVNYQTIGIHQQGMQNGSVHPYLHIKNSDSPSSTKHAVGRSVFAPTTPDSWQRMTSDVASGSSNPVTNQGSNEQKLLQEHEVATAIIDLKDNQNEQVPGPTTETSPGTVSAAVEENLRPDKGGNQVIDLNQTPQKKARRRRYQPKVIRETKPKRTPQPKMPKPTDSKETRVKRKYVRKDEANTPAVLPGGEATEACDPKPAEQSAKSCRRSLNFDLNGKVTEQDSDQLSNDGPGGQPQANECQKTEKSRNPVCWSREEELMFGTSQLNIAYDLNLSVNQELSDYISLSTKDSLASSQTDVNNFWRQMEKSAHSLSRINAKNLSRKDSGSARSPNSSPCASSNEGEQSRGSKRSHFYTATPKYVDAEIAAMAHSKPWQPSHISPGSTHTETLPQRFIPEICKKRRTEKVQRPHITSTPLSAAASEDINQETKAHSHPRFELFTSKYYYCNTTPSGGSEIANHQAKVSVERSESREQLQKTWVDLSRLTKKRRSKGATRVRDLTPLAGIATATKTGRSRKTNVTSEPKSYAEALTSIRSCTEALSAEENVKPRSRGRSRKGDSVNNNRDLVIYGSYQSTKKERGSVPALPWRKSNSVEDIIQILERLDINREDSTIPCQAQTALVPYHVDKKEQSALVPYARNGSIVPFEGPFRKRQRAKVELDDETTRVWRLLLENIDNEGIDGTDEDKAKWWENERTVFRGRVDSFIARMRLVQGDRRFTPWKGSVLDSVIGVFLTQNVSDHLSSSAFMSMAARFPLKPKTSGSTQSEEATSVLVVEPDICELEPEESITWNVKTMGKQTLDRNSKIIHVTDPSEQKEAVNSREQSGKSSGSVSPTEYSSEACRKASNYFRADNANSQTAETEIAYVLRDDRARDDATSSQQSVLSSQNSISSPNRRIVGIMDPFSESHPIGQAVTATSQYNYGDYSTSFMNLLNMVDPPLPPESYQQTYLQTPAGDMNHGTRCSPEAPDVSSSIYQLNLEAGFYLQDTKGIDMLDVESRSSDMSRKDENSPATEQSNITSELTEPEKNSDSISGASQYMCSFYVLEGEKMVIQSQRQTVNEPVDTVASSSHAETSPSCNDIHVPQSSHGMTYVREGTTATETTNNSHKEAEKIPKHNYDSGVVSDKTNENIGKTGRGKAGKGKKNDFDWDSLRKEAEVNGQKREKTANTMDSLDWEAVRQAHVSDIAETIKERGMNNMLAERIKDLLDRLVRDHGSIDMEWLRDIPPDKAKEYLLSFRGLGLKSVECVRLLTLHHLAFPVDTNVGRIAVRLGWVPLQPLPESLQLHLLELYPVLESIQKYLWPRLCKLDQKTLYELHYHMITFGKVFCTKRQPNCNACPLRGECRHFASAFASARFALPGPEERRIIPSAGRNTSCMNTQTSIKLLPSTASCSNENSQTSSRLNNASTIQVPSFPFMLPLPQTVHLERKSINSICEPIVEVPASPEPEPQQEQGLADIEDTFYEDPNEIPTIQLNMKEFTQTLQNFMQTNRDLQEAGVSNALVALTAEAASLPTPKLKNISRLRTEHHVYELPDRHPLLNGMNRREPDDPCSYLLAIWTPGETANSIEPPARKCSFDDPSMLCYEETCSYCSSRREADSQTVRGTLLIPCRTAMRGSFPLNGTYFQVNEVFADHDSSLNPIDVPRSWLWNLPRRTVYFGTSIPTLFRGMSTEDIQHCFWRGYVCVRGFDQKTRAPRPLMARLHFPASRLARGTKGKAYDE